MFNQYPYLNLNDLNLDYLLSEIKKMYNEVTNFVSINAIKYADPIQWNITSQYEKNTVVIDPLTGTAYISVAAVPSGVALTRTEYWTVVFDLGSFVTRAAQNFTSHWESDTTTTATFPTTAGDWLVWGDVLYKTLTNITAGDTYVVGGNIEHFTIEDLYTSLLNTIGDLDDLDTTVKTSIVDAINSVLNSLRGSITVNYENDFTASVAWTSGTWLYINNNLYEVIAPVSVGETLVVDTNIKPRTVEYLVRSGLSSVRLRINNVQYSITVNHESDYIATSAWTVGTWLYINDNLYEVIANCAINDALVVGTNITARTVEYFVTRVRNYIGDITTLKTDDKTNVVSAINEVYDKISSYDGITLFISDSYGQGAGTPNGAGQYTSFITTMKQKLHMTEGVDCYTNAYGGSGFVAAIVGKSFLTLLEELDARVPADDHDKVSRIVVAGGYNDVNLTGLESAIATFMNRARQYFPNAKVYCAHIGWTTNVSNRVSLSNNIAIWKHEVPLNGGIYIANSEYILHNYGAYFDADGVHPNNTGQLFLALYLNEGIFTGVCDVDSALQGFSITPSSYVESVDFSGFVRLKNGSVYFNPNSPLNVKFNSGVTIVSGEGYSLGTLSSGWIRSLGNPNFNAFPCGGYAKFTFSGTDFYVPVAGSLNLNSANGVDFKLDFVAPSGNTLQNLVDNVEMHLNVNSTVFDALMI